jgi:hypothetical protein
MRVRTLRYKQASVCGICEWNSMFDRNAYRHGAQAHRGLYNRVLHKEDKNTIATSAAPTNKGHIWNCCQSTHCESILFFTVKGSIGHPSIKIWIYIFVEFAHVKGSGEIRHYIQCG